MADEEPRTSRIGIINLIELDPVKDSKKIEKSNEKLIRYSKGNPDFSFSLIENYYSLQESIRRGDPLFDIIIARRMMDIICPSANNICVAAYDARNRFEEREEYLRKGTVWIISFNEALEETKMIDIPAQKAYIDMLRKQGEGHCNPDIGGIVLTECTDRDFLMEIAREILDNRGAYIRYVSPYTKSRVKMVETYAEFINNPPGHTRGGVDQ